MTTSPLEDTTSLSLTEVLELLADQRRRHLIVCLSERSLPVSVDILVDEVTARECGEPPSECLERRERIRVSLHHAHLPVLAGANVVSYDPAEETVSRGANMRVVTRYLACVASCHQSVTASSSRGVPDQASDEA